MDSTRRKAHSLSNIFRRKNNSRHVPTRDQHDGLKKDTALPTTSNDLAGSSTNSKHTIEDSSAPSTQSVQDIQQSEAHEVDSPPTYQLTEQAQGSISSEVDPNRLGARSTSYDQDHRPFIPTRTPPFTSVRSSSEPAIPSRDDSYARYHSNNPEDDASHKGLPDYHSKLWDEAYDQLKRLEPDLIKAYEKILTKDYDIRHELDVPEENIIEQHDRIRRHMQMDMILRDVLKKTNTPTGVERKVTDAINVVLSLKRVIDSSLQAVPIAAVAWTGVCIGLQLISNTIAQEEARNTGVVDIALKMRWYSSLSQVVLDDENKKLANLRNKLSEGILDFYVSILACLFKCICATYKGRAQIFKGMLKLDDWENVLNLTNKKEASFRDAIRNYGDERKISYLELLVDLCRSSAEDEIMRKLFVVNMKAEVQSLQHRKDDLIPESSNWILSNTLFLKFSDWEDENQYRRLWIKGKAGMGKTMLLIGIVEKLEHEIASQHETRFDPPYLSYFFCQGTNGRLNTATAVVRGLIWMLLRQEHSLIQHASGLAGQNLDDDLSTFLELKTVLLAMLKNPIMKRVYIIIDALDECIDTGRSDAVPGRAYLLDLIARVSREYPNVKCLISSRDEVDIELKFSQERAKKCTSLQLELGRKVLAGPIEAYINKKMANLSDQYLAEWEVEGEVEDEDREMIHQKLKAVTKEMHRKADGTFLWVALIFLRIDDERTDLRELPALVSETPEKLEEIYEKMKLQIRLSKGANSRLCIKALSIATTANRPLRLAELRLLADLPRDVPPLKIFKLCRFFRIAEDDDGQKTVYMIHQSAKQWLEQQLRQGLLDDVRSTDHLASVHSILAKRCIEILNGALRRNIWNLPYPGIQIEEIQSQPERGTLSTDHEDQNPKHRVVYAPKPSEDELVPVTYAILNWLDHLLKASASDIDAILPMVLQFIQGKFLYWLEALSLLRRIGEGAAIISRLSRFIEDPATFSQSSTTLTELVSLVRDANRFTLYFRGIIEIAPLQVYTAGLEFSPMNSQVKTLFKEEQLPCISLSPAVEENWSPCLQTIEAHKGSVFCVAFSHDGKRLASASHDKTIRVWAAETGTLQQTLQGHQDWVSSIAFSRDGKQLASGSHDRSVRIWDAETGNLQHRLTENQDLVSSVAFSPRGNRLVSGSHDGMIRIYDPKTGAICRVIRPSDVWVLSVAFSHDGTMIAAGLHDGKVGIWYLASGTQYCLLQGHKNSVSSVAFSHDDKHIASGSHDRTIRIWNVADQELHQTLEGHKSPVLSLSFSPNGDRLAFGSRDNLVRIWNTQTNVVEITLKGHRNSILSVAFSPDGKRLASGSQDKIVRIWDTDIAAAPGTSYCHSNSVCSLAFANNSKLLASGSFDNTVRIWNSDTGVLSKVLTGHRNSVYALAFSDDGKYLVSASHDKTARIWSTINWKLQHILKGHKNSIFAVSISPDGQLIASGSHDKTVRIWSRETGTLRHTLTGHSNSVSSVAFSTDGSLLISGSHDKSARIWDIKTGVLRWTLNCETSVSSIAFSRDGKRVAAGVHSDAVVMWDIGTGELEKTEIDQLESFGVGFSPSLLSFSEDRSGLLTERGYIPFPSSSADHQPLTRSTFSILGDKSWITREGNKLIWVPWEYRPACLMVQGHTMAIGCASGRVYLLGFSPSIAEV